MNRIEIAVALIFAVALTLLMPCASTARAEDLQWLTFEGKDGAGKGKQVVLISGDDEYRSEEMMPQLAKILSKEHGFKTTVTFALDPKTGEIAPKEHHNIPGLEALQTADLMIIATRFRDLPDDQMKYVDEYLKAGKPVIGMRTATHAFSDEGVGKSFKKYNWGNGDAAYKQGFGRQVLGETWVNHWGAHGSQSTRGLIAESAKESPIVKGLKDGDVWGPTDVYEIRLKELAPGFKPIIMGQVLTGMTPDAKPLEGPKNDPMMPVAWTRTYKGEKEGRVFATTMGAATDMATEGTRRLIVNAVYWTLGMEDKIPAEGSKVDLVGEYKPSAFGFDKEVKGKKPADYISGGEDMLVKGK